MNDDTESQEKKGRRRFVLPSLIAALLLVGVVAIVMTVGSRDGNADTVTAGETKNGKKGNGKDEKEKAPIPVSVAAVEREEISSFITTTANLVAENEVRVLAETEGRVARLNVEEGAHVAEGAVLATLVPDDARMAVRKAEVRARNARVDHERLRRLLDQNLISRGDYEKIEMEKDVAEQELAEAQWRMAKTVIRAPFSGVVSRRDVTAGKHVRPGDPLFTVTDLDPLIAEIYLPERDAMALDLGRTARITMKADETVRFEGRIRQISPVVDTQTGTVKITIEAARRPVQVRPGAFVQVDIVRERHSEATVLPREAVIRELQKAHVFVANGSTAQKRVVQLGIEEGARVQVLSGIKPGEQVIVAGQGGLKDGSPIKILGDSPDLQKGS